VGQKSKAVKHDLKELIIEKYDGGKNTIIYVTEELNKHLQQNGLKITISREAIRRAVRSYEDEVADVRKSIEISKAMAEVLKDHPGTEQSESMLMCIASLIAKEIRNYESINFDDPVDMIDAVTKLTTAQNRLAQSRTQAVKALDKAKAQLKTELQKAIQHDHDLLDRLCKIVDEAKVK
jgi:hypothetical protein